MIKGSTGKGIFHAALSALAIAEMFTASTKKHIAMLGACAGYHVHAAVYHFFLEDEQERKENLRNSMRPETEKAFNDSLYKNFDLIRSLSDDDAKDYNEEGSGAFKYTDFSKVKKKAKPKHGRKKK